MGDILKIRQLKKKLELAESAEEKIHVLADMANMYWEQRDSGEMLKCAEQLKALSEEAGNEWGLGKALGFLGNTCFFNSNYDRALEYYMSAMKHFDPTRNKSELSKSFNDIGNVYERLEKNDLSLEYYQQSLRISQEIGDLKYMAYTMNNLANIHTHLGNYEKALDTYSESIRVSRLINNPVGIAIGLLNTGELYHDLGEYQKALEFDHKALEIFEESNHQMGISYCLYNIGNVQHRLKNDIIAREFLLKALEMTRQINYVDSQRDIYRALSNVARDTGNHAEALEWYKKYFEQRQFMFNQESSKRVAELETRYKVDLKEKEAEIYRLKKQDLEKALSQVMEAYSELERTQSEMLRVEQRNTALALAVRTNEDMNQPLMVIKGSCELLKIQTKNFLTEKQEKYFTRMFSSIERIESILTKIQQIDPTATQEYAAEAKMFDIHFDT
jgi:tetratricopeptide (TPR) repeat protein